MFYAQIDENNVVYAITQATGKIDNSKCIPIDSFDSSLDYALYDPTIKTFEKRQRPIPPPSPPSIEDEVKTLKEQLKATQDTLDFLLLG